jgi:hypothetical protein
MTDRKNKTMAERRAHQRFKAKSGTINHGDKSADIIDISMGGLSFSYVEDEAWSNESFDCGMLMGEKDLCLEDIPLKIISDCAINSGLSITRRCGVKFEKLTAKQLAQLEYFIWTNTNAPADEVKIFEDEEAS